jgi:predicted alpha/beta hydrolase family esterase
MMRDVSILSVPGYTSAGPDHWLTRWERQADPHIVRVEQSNWTECDPLKWVETLNSAIINCSKPPFLVAHSMGCLTIAKWAADRKTMIAGAMLVAPPDVDATTTWDALTPFRPVPLQALKFPAVVVASSNDPHCSLHRAKRFSDAWGADFVDIGNAGHIATADGFGDWEEGLKLLHQRLN